MPERSTSRWSVDTLEDAVKLLGLLGVAGAALSASFSHVHDWTVDVLMGATGLAQDDLSWLGWVNAMCSELIPLLALLSLRRRLAAGLGLMSYALALVLAGAVMSLGAQLAWVGGAEAGVSAQFLACVPALTFMLLSKLVVGDLDVARKRKADAAAAAAKRKAEAEAVAARIRKAEAEVTAARKAEAEAVDEAEAAQAEAAAARAEAAQAEAGRVQAEAEIATLQSASGQSEAETARQLTAARQAAEAGRRDADRAAGELAAVRAQAERDRAELLAMAADVQGRADLLAAELAAVRSGARKRPAATPVSPAGPRPEIRLADGSPVPDVEGAKPETVAAVLDAVAANPTGTQAEIAAAAGVSDRTVRTIRNALQPA
jgi:hypothetical protein